MSQYRAINIEQKFSLIDEQWSPRVVAEINDYQFKLVKLEGHFVWHQHDHTDEAFLVLAGELRIEFRDGHVTLGAGEMYVVPRGVEHRPVALNQVKLLLVEPSGVTNTGDSAASELTAPNNVWV